MCLFQKHIINNSVNYRRKNAVNNNGSRYAEHICARAENPALALKLHGGGYNGIGKTRYGYYRPCACVVRDFVKNTECRECGSKHYKRHGYQQSHIVAAETDFCVNNAQTLTDCTHRAADNKRKNSVFDFVCGRRCFLCHFAVFAV